MCRQARDAWCVAFGNAFNEDDRCLLAGYDNGDLKLFDLRTNTCRAFITIWSITPWVAHVAVALLGAATAMGECVPCRVRFETSLDKGVCGVSFDRQDIAMNKFAATCLESRCHFFDARTQHPKTGATVLPQSLHISPRAHQHMTA